MNRLLAIARKELIQLRRDRLTLAMTIVIPVLQLLLFGWAINTDVRHIPTVVFDQDHSAASRDLPARMQATGYYDVVGYVESYAAIEVALRQGHAKVGLVIPVEFGARLERGEATEVQLIVDGSDPMTVGSATNTAGSLAQSRSHDLLVERLASQGNRTQPAGFGVEAAIWYNQELRTAVYIVPGIVGVILTMTMVMLTSMAIARERERGTLEALIVSPARSIEITTGKILPYIAIGYVQMTMILIAGWVVFDVPMVGSLWLLYVCTLPFIAANLAVGLLFSTWAKTQQQAMQMSFFFFLPNVLLSGFMFPFEGMPRGAQWLAQALPLTHYLRIVRRITLMRAGWNDVEIEMIWLVALLAALVALASMQFKKKLI